jgi:hypothetical protein
VGDRQEDGKAKLEETPQALRLNIEELEEDGKMKEEQVN